jgi:imidazolonepropionase-like amidohydrolase
VVAIVGARLIDGSGGPATDDVVIVIEGTRIRNVGPRSHTPVPKGGDIVDGQGKTVIPGLVDADARYAGSRDAVEASLRSQLEHGVTAAGARGLSASFDGLLADLRAGRSVGPRVYAVADSGAESRPGANPTGREIHEEMELLVASGRLPLEVIAAMTRGNSERIGGANAEFGIVAAGKIADLVALAADPTEDIRHTRRILQVMQAGRWVRGAGAGAAE